MALYQTRRNGVIPEEQYQAIQQNPASFLYKGMHLERQTIMKHLLQAFLPKQHFMFVWLNRAMIFLCHRFCFLILSQILLISVCRYQYVHSDTNSQRVCRKIWQPPRIQLLREFSSPCPSENSDPLIVSLRQRAAFKIQPPKPYFSVSALLSGGLHSMQDWGFIHTGWFIQLWVANGYQFISLYTVVF